MYKRRWFTGVVVMVVLFVFLGLGHGTIAALYSLFYSMNWKLVYADMKPFFYVVPLHLLAGMYVIAHCWYGMRIHFAWQRFLCGLLAAALLLAKSCWVHGMIQRADYNIVLTKIFSMAGISTGHTVFMETIGAMVLWSLYMLLLLVAYSFLCSSLYELPGKSWWQGYLSFFRTNILRLIFWSFLFGIVHFAIAALAIVYHVQRAVQIVGDFIFGRENFSALFTHFYIGELLVSVFLLAVMLWVVVSLFARMQRKQEENDGSIRQ
jgi:hypothetical protein